MLKTLWVIAKSQMTKRIRAFRKSGEFERIKISHLVATIVLNDSHRRKHYANINCCTVIHLIRSYFFQTYYWFCIKCSGPDGSLVHACDCCNTYFASAGERDAHHADVHKEKLTCNVCDKYFPKYETLVGHLRNHAKRKYFICAKCG